MPTIERYRHGARFYDVLSGEWPVYGAGRVAALDLLALQPGERVIDLGCGTGLNLPGVLEAIGPTGRVVGVDRSPDMLAVARRRVQRLGAASQVTLIEADATTVASERLSDALGARADAVIATYTLSIMADARAAWQGALAACRPGARVAIVDMHDPRGASRLFVPLARAFAGFGGADLDAHPWTMIEEGARNVRSRSLRGGHIQVRQGELP